MSTISNILQDMFVSDITDTAIIAKSNKAVDVIVNQKDNPSNIGGNISITNAITMVTMRSADVADLNYGDIITINNIDYCIDNINIEYEGFNDIEVSYA